MNPRLRVVAALLIAALVCLAYRPSLGHVPRADQWWYLLQTAHQDDFGSLIARTYSYNRTVSQGDYGLFRPVLFALLSAETAAFGHDFAKWQAVGIALHLAVVGLLLTLAGRLGVGWLGYAAALFFALNFALVEMVMWSHINGYMLFVALELGAMILAFDLLTRPADRPRPRLTAAWGLLLVAAFTYEIGQFFAVAVGAVLAYDAWSRGERGRAVGRLLAFASILLLYQAADRLDRLAHPEAPRDVDYRSVLAAAASWNTATQALRYAVYTLVQPFVPGGMTFSPYRGWNIYTRLGFSEPLAAWPTALRLTPLLAVSVAAGVLIAARTGLALAAPRRRGRLLFLLLPLSLFGLHLGVTVLGRLNLRPDILGYSTYYSYLPLLMLLIGLLTLWSAAPPVPRLDVPLVATLVVLGLVMGWRVSHLTKRVRDQVRPFRVQHQFFQSLIREHAGDPRFGIAVEREAAGQFASFFFVPFPMILYPRVVNADDPTHVVFFDGGKPRALTVAEHRRLRPGRAVAPPVRMVRAESPCTIFLCRGRYYGVPHWDGVYDPDRDDHRYLVEGATEREVLDQLPARDARMRADEETGRFIPPHLSVEPAGDAHRGYALFRTGPRFYAVPAGEGPLDPRRLIHGRYSRWLTATDLASLRAEIDRLAAAGMRDGGPGGR
ncbi:MAG: hypothetical protein ACRC33_05060 [Gemmataceae bacterium]